MDVNIDGWMGPVSPGITWPNTNGEDIWTSLHAIPLVAEGWEMVHGATCSRAKGSTDTQDPSHQTLHLCWLFLTWHSCLSQNPNVLSLGSSCP